jgi:hypothetical protein
MESSASCNLCASCLKTCPNDSIQITLRPPTKELWFIRKPKIEESFLAIVIMGIVFVQNITMLEVWQSMLNGLQHLTGTTNYFVNFTFTFLIAMGLPIGLLTLAALAAGKINGDSLAHNFAKFGYAIIPLDIAGHVAHNLFHLLAEGKAVAFTALELTGQQVTETSTAFVSTSTIQILQYILVVLGVLGSIYTIYRIAKKQYGEGKIWSTLVPYAVLIIAFGILNLWLFALPMSMRM